MEEAVTLLQSTGASARADGCLAMARLLRHNNVPGFARQHAVKMGAIRLLVAALQDHSKGGDANAWLQATTTLRHVVRTAVTASPRLQALSADGTAAHQRLAASLP